MRTMKDTDPVCSCISHVACNSFKSQLLGKLIVIIFILQVSCCEKLNVTELFRTSYNKRGSAVYAKLNYALSLGDKLRSNTPL